MATKLPTTQVELKVLLDKAKDEGFTRGTIAALAVVALHGQSVLWREIVEASGAGKVLRMAKKDQGAWAWGGFKSYARSELGADRVRIMLAPKTTRVTK